MIQKYYDITLLLVALRAGNEDSFKKNGMVALSTEQGSSSRSDLESEILFKYVCVCIPHYWNTVRLQPTFSLNHCVGITQHYARSAFSNLTQVKRYGIINSKNSEQKLSNRNRS